MQRRLLDLLMRGGNPYNMFLFVLEGPALLEGFLIFLKKAETSFFFV
jgi:hypothetical protein